MLNKVILQGRIGNDPELKTTTSGKEVCSINLAVDRDYKSQNGERETDWITVVAFREKAKFLSRYFSKGRMAVVEGRLQIRDWTDKDGSKRRTAEVVADNVYFGDSKNSTSGVTQQDNFGALNERMSHGFAEVDGGDDLPF